MKYRKIVVGCVLFVGLLLYYIRVGTTLPFTYYDEAWWIGQSYFYDLLLHDRKNPVWDSVYSYDQPQLVHYIFGAVLYPKFKKEHAPDFLNYLSDHHLLCRECIGMQDLPRGVSMVSKEEFSRDIYTPAYRQTREIILSIRKVNSIAAAGTVIVMYLLGVAIWGIAGGLLFALLYGLNGIIVTTTLVAHADALFLLFYSCGLFALYHYLVKNKKWDALYIGLCIGLAASVKIVGFMLLPMVMVLQVIRKSEMGRIIRECIIVTIVSLSIFIFLNPFVQQDTVHRLMVMYQHRAAQQQLFGVWFPGDSLPNLPRRMYSIFEQFFPGRAAWYGMPLLLAGLVSYGSKFRKSTINGFVPILGYYIICMSLLWLTVRWDRYYAPMVWVIIATQVEGVIYLVRRKSSFPCFVSRWGSVI